MFKSSRIYRLAALAVFILLATGCAGGRLKDARNAFINDGDPQTAVQILDKGNSTGLSTLLFNMEKGLLLHQAGRFQESITELRKASILMEKQDYLSVGQQTASILVNDWLTEYKGEYCERMWVHTYLMINYFLVNQFEDALVEAKKAMQVFDAYPDALSEAYFTMALIGLCYETLNEYNDAYIVYKRLSKMMPDPAPIREKLFRMGRLSGIEDPADYEIMNQASNQNPHPVSPDMGELVLFVGMGNGPVKVPGNVFLPPGLRFSFPRYENRSSTSGYADLYTSDNPLPVKTVTADLGRVARTSLGERAKQIIIKETARVIAKEAIVQRVESENDEIVGLITRLALMAIEEPDTRSWQTLPADNSLLRLPLDPGTYHLTVKIKGSGTSNSIDLPPITMEKGRRIFFAIRANDNHVFIHSQIRPDSPKATGSPIKGLGNK